MHDVHLAAMALILFLLCLWLGPMIGRQVAAAGRRRGWHAQRTHSAGRYADALTMVAGAIVVSIMVAARFG